MIMKLKIYNLNHVILHPSRFIASSSDSTINSDFTVIFRSVRAIVQKEREC